MREETLHAKLCRKITQLHSCSILFFLISEITSLSTNYSHRKNLFSMDHQFDFSPPNPVQKAFNV